MLTEDYLNYKDYSCVGRPPSDGFILLRLLEREREREKQVFLSLRAAMEEEVQFSLTT